jgi:spermidine synthase
MFYCLAEDPSDEFVALRDLVSLELCHKYLPDLFSKESILKTERLTKEIIDKARDVCKLTKVNFDLILINFNRIYFRNKHDVFMKWHFFKQLMKMMKNK